MSSNDATSDYSLGCLDYSLDSENTNGIEFGTHFLTGKIADKMQEFPEFESKILDMQSNVNPAEL